MLGSYHSEVNTAFFLENHILRIGGIMAAESCFKCRWFGVVYAANWHHGVGCFQYV